ncbi:thioredoxin family protein [Staphylococcus felis]|uniref:thioredoxin family protein n=1 Tax=Staphylococcus felis TaxID=46127 RepID=UPI000E2343A5|nr:thioredoxin family protein [Staphylococcus felis]REH76886.1 thioredoxin family protein [Staphylococcus felis]REI30183.1 thioredoxin family protein [Staphylococcus felis]
MVNLKTYYEQSKPLSQYIDDMTSNQAGIKEIDQRFVAPQNEPQLKKIKQKNYKYVLVISEDWCGDAMMNIPVLKHIAEQCDLEVRVFYRDEDTNLIDQYLTNGKSRSIPIFVFLNDQFEQKAVWGPRAKEVQNFVDDIRSKHLPDKKDPLFDDKQKEVHQMIRNRYLTDSQFWLYIYHSILDRLTS